MVSYMHKKFTFSIIIAIYNTEKYLSEAIESIINQSFDFNKVQIILVDDGSTDHCKDICHSFVEKYPKNIFYIYQENSGQSIARNNGLNIATGKYVNFLDSDDKLDLNTLEDVNNFFDGEGKIVDVVVIERHNFGITNGPSFLHSKYEVSRVVDINEEYDFPQLSISASFIRKDALSERFNSDLIISEDSLVINKTILKKCKYGVVSSARYLYRKRAEQNSTVDTKKHNKKYFVPRMNLYFKELINYSISHFGYVLKYIQSVLMYDLQWYFLDNTQDILNENELNQFQNLILEVIQVIEDDIILSQRFLNKFLEYQILNMKYKLPDFEVIYNSNELILSYKNMFFDNLTNQNIVISETYAKFGLLYVKGYFDTYYENIQVNAYHNKNELNIIQINDDEIQSIGYTISKRFHFFTVLELNNGLNKISFKISLNSKEYDVKLLNKTFNDDAIVENNCLLVNINNEQTKFNYSLFDLKSIENNISKFLDNENNIPSDEAAFENEILRINKIPKVSIIIPVFNPGKLLHRCLNSVINQSLKEIEVICVDDGSSDDSPKILDEYAKNDSRIKVFHQKNKGAGFSRNKAINESDGEYIMFVDSDDWIDKDMCKKLYNHAQKLNSDLVVFDALWHTLDGINEFKFFSSNEFKENYKSFIFNYRFIKNKIMLGSYGVIWSKFYKSSFIKDNDIQFPQHKIYNDVEFHFKTTLLAKSITYFPEPFYHYIRLGQPSLQTTFREGKDELVWFDVLLGLYNILTENDLMKELRLDFINFCIYYSFDKLKNIELEYQNNFLNKLKSFFEILSPTSDELKQLETTNINWYNKITVKYLPIYNDLMQEDMLSLKIHLLEFKIEESKNNLENASNESKEELYQDIRQSFIDYGKNNYPLNEMSLELYSFYIAVINFKTYYNFNLFNKEVANGVWKKIDKRKLSFEIENFNRSGLNLEKRNHKIIVSLTSFPERIYDIHYCIYSLLTQKFKPDLVILWLAEEQFPNKELDLPKELLKLKDNGLTIKWCNDIKPYKKLIPALKEYPNDYIITVDDDIFYHEDWLMNLWNQYKKYPCTIIASRARRMNLNSNGSIDDYTHWNIISKENESSFLNFPTGAGGTLYFPNSLSEIVFDQSLFMNLCPAGDDIWFWAMAVLNKTKIKVVEKPITSLTYINVAREIGVLNEITLWNSNKKGKNDTQMQKVISKFPQILDIIQDE